MSKFFIWSTSVALAGFLFGFDTVVISGAERTLQELWHTTNTFHGVIVMGMALWGTVLGAIFGGVPTDRYGRRNTLIGIGVLFFISAVGSALANGAYVFAFFRFIGGLGVGVSTIAAPAYISEIAPTTKRGRLVAMYQLSIVVGILIAFVSNYFLQNIEHNAWRWMMGVEAFPALIYCVVVFFVPRSPRWLVVNKRFEEAGNVLKLVNPDIDITDFVKQVSKSGDDRGEHIFSTRYRKVLGLVFFIAFFNQFSGINAFLYYGPRIFEEAGLASDTALLSSVGIGIVNVLFTLLGMSLIDRFGRKLLMYLGSVGYILSLSLGAASFFLGWKGMAVPVFLFVFVASHAIGQGTVIWVFIAELFPTHLRASGQAFGSSVHWVLAALIPSFIPLLFDKIGAGYVFAFFACMMVGQLVWVYLKMPETKGVPLEELNKELVTSE